MSDIGKWARRLRADRSEQSSKWHKIESEVASAVITKCGRRMERQAKWHYTGLYTPLSNHLEITDEDLRYGRGGSMTESDVIRMTCLQCHNA